jgi:hypothetical protein
MRLGLLAVDAGGDQLVDVFEGVDRHPGRSPSVVEPPAILT